MLSGYRVCLGSTLLSTIKGHPEYSDTVAGDERRRCKQVRLYYLEEVQLDEVRVGAGVRLHAGRRQRCHDACSGLMQMLLQEVHIPVDTLCWLLCIVWLCVMHSI